jgi:hypothetical protein
VEHAIDNIPTHSYLIAIRVVFGAQHADFARKVPHFRIAGNSSGGFGMLEAPAQG